MITSPYGCSGFYNLALCIIIIIIIIITFNPLKTERICFI
jgi:hypothetical protein